MLRRLSLRNFVLVSELEIDFQNQFTVLTGETGAGKSILIDALQLALGARGDVAVVREGTTQAEITAVFDTPKIPALNEWLENAGFNCEDGELLLRRIIDHQGKSRAWINGSPATITQLKELSEFLVDIHGQHAWQGLTKPERVRELLDDYGEIDTTRLTPLWATWKTAKNKLTQAQAQLEHLQIEQDRLAWQIGEVDKLAPQKDEWEELNQEHQRLSHAQMLIESTQKSCQTLGEEPQNVSEQLQHTINTLEKAAAIDPQLAEVVSVLNDAYALVDDAHHSLNGWLKHIDLDPERLDSLDNRMGNWLSLARRYRRKPEELYELYAEWKKELTELNEGLDVEALEKNVLVAEKEWMQEAQQISEKRKMAAPLLSHKITVAMQHLGMKDGRFEVALTPLPEPQASGLEHIDFLVAGHAGATPRPVAKVASGGELSRLALAIAVTTSQLAHTPTLIFDEVDSGIGGSVAQTVGELMQQLGKDKQVLSVTHLAQVAAYATQHLVVSKQTQAAAGQPPETTSHVSLVNGQYRIEEIARMLGGDERSQAGYAHAQEMLQLAQQK